jgi:hypothetical protein
MIVLPAAASPALLRQRWDRGRRTKSAERQDLPFAELTRLSVTINVVCACAVSTPLTGGGVAEWLKAAVC